MKAIKKNRKRRIKVTTTPQYDMMVKFMVENPTFATYEMVTNDKNKDKYNSLWDTLSVQLNVEGPPIRNMLEWKKVWVDYKHNIKKKCFIMQRIEIDQRTGGTGDKQEVKFSDNELAIKELIFDTSINFCTFSNTTPLKSDTLYTTSPTPSINNNQDEVTIFKTELADIFIDDMDANVLLNDTISPPTTLVNFDVARPSNQLSLLEEQAEIEKKLEKIKKEKLKILRQTADIKERLQEKLYELKKRKFELKCQQFKYKAQKIQLKKKVLQMSEVSNL